MVAIAIAAAWCSILHAALNYQQGLFYNDYHELTIGALPMAFILFHGLVVGCSDIVRRGRCRPFLLGFEFVGWAMVLAYVSFMAVEFQAGFRPVARLAPLTEHALGLPVFYLSKPKVVAFQTLVLTAPQLVVALVGGWVTHSLGITVVRERRPGQVGGNSTSADPSGDV
jgi:hypothetical protein